MAAAGLSGPPAAGQEARTVQSLYQDCKATGERYTGCLRYLTGVGDMMDTIGTIRGSSPLSPDVLRSLFPFAMCLPEKVTLGQMNQVFLNWTEANPKRWQEPEEIGVWTAFQDAWPCNR